MASGIIKHPHFEMEYETDYTKWFTPVSGFTPQSGNATIRHVERNIYYIYLIGAFSANTIEANKFTQIGTYKKEFFGDKNVSMFVPAFVNANGSSLIYSTIVRFSTVQSGSSTGVIEVLGGSVATATVAVNGILVRREV